MLGVRKISSVLPSFLWKVRFPFIMPTDSNFLRPSEKQELPVQAGCKICKAVSSLDPTGAAGLRPLPLVSHGHRSHHLISLGEVLWAWKKHLDPLWRRVKYTQGCGCFMICKRWIIQGTGLQLDFLFPFLTQKFSSETHFPQLPKWFCNKSVNLISLLCGGNLP